MSALFQKGKIILSAFRDALKTLGRSQIQRQCGMPAKGATVGSSSRSHVLVPQTKQLIYGICLLGCLKLYSPNLKLIIFFSSLPRFIKSLASSSIAPTRKQLNLVG